MTTILSVSINKDQKNFIDESGLSPSHLLQRAIDEMMINEQVTNEKMRGLYKNINSLQGVINKQGSFIDKHGLMQTYLDFEDV